MCTFCRDVPNASNRYELPEQHEPLLVLLPAHPEKINSDLAGEMKSRRAAGATAVLVADQELLKIAMGNGLLEEGVPEKGAGAGAGMYVGGVASLMIPGCMLHCKDWSTNSVNRDFRRPEPFGDHVLFWRRHIRHVFRLSLGSTSFITHKQRSTPMTSNTTGPRVLPGYGSFSLFLAVLYKHFLVAPKEGCIVDHTLPGMKNR